MSHSTVEVIAAGHICVDVIPAIGGAARGLDALLTPGALVHVGPALLATGGAVANTGLALHRLGVPTRLMGKIGDDLFGQAITDRLRALDSTLAEGMIVAPGEATSYTVVINPPGVDRVFLHCPGTNDTFSAADIDDTQFGEARLLHFGYPPLMRRMYLDDGRELVNLLQRARSHGLTTTLDMAQPDPTSEAGQVDWTMVLRGVLPQVDLFLPSAEELIFMLDRERFAALHRYPLDGALLSTLAAQLLDWGAAVVALKLGDQGLYLRTTSDLDRLRATGRAAPRNLAAWRGRELLVPCFQVAEAGTTGAGDCTIAGFIAALLHGDDPEAALTHAVAVGACSVEQADATSGVPHWNTVMQRIERGWPRRPLTLSLPGWHWDAAQAVWRSEQDGV